MQDKDCLFRPAGAEDFDRLVPYETHIAEEELVRALTQGRVFLLERSDELIGFLRCNLFWDNTPFCNFLYVLEAYRGQGFGSKLLCHFEETMREKGYPAVMTSTQAAEDARYFYAKRGYRIVGGFWPEGEGYELLLTKTL